MYRTVSRDETFASIETTVCITVFPKARQKASGVHCRITVYQDEVRQKDERALQNNSTETSGQLDVRQKGRIFRVYSIYTKKKQTTKRLCLDLESDHQYNQQ